MPAHELSIYSEQLWMFQVEEGHHFKSHWADKTGITLRVFITISTALELHMHEMLFCDIM